MKILVEDEIQRAVTYCEPSKIAVAYIGADWSTFIPDAHRIDAVVVSPALDTNPLAITELTRNIG